MHLTDPLSSIKGVGLRLTSLLKKLNLNTVNDLLEYYPRRYDDYSSVSTIAQIKPGPVTIKAHILQINGKNVRGGLHVTEAIASDETGSLRIVWFNQPFRATSIVKHENYYISGLFEFRNNRLSLTNPSIELTSTFPINTARIVPIYRETKGLTSSRIRKILKQIFTSNLIIKETLPSYIVNDHTLLTRRSAIYAKHFPMSNKEIKQANDRLGFEELFEIILASQYTKSDLAQNSSIKIPFRVELATKFIQNLPFNLTDDQKKAVWQIYQDMASDKVMNRLLEGDVGTGKTLVATMSAIMAIDQSFQVILMAPTELLARQHAKTIYSLLQPLGLADTIILLVGGMSAKEKTQARSKIKDGTAKFIIGTHTLIQDKVDFNKLALVIVDEQHRFGVDQRKKLLAKAGHIPHMLSLTATPIPRSLALTIFGELDISIINQKPKNRLLIKTHLIAPIKRQKVYNSIKTILNSGQQMFVVCPLIEESDVLSIKSIEKTYQELKSHFNAYKIGLLHGKMKSDKKQDIMHDFVSGKLDILVSTTVIEVGVDVPNATIMMIESPERFGLAQLHQLRGRVGRGDKQGHCYLMLSDSQPPSRRLRAIESAQDGFKLAELDLEIRGAGALYGKLQHGQLDFKLVDFTDTKLIAKARLASKVFMENPNNLLKYPYIRKRIEQLQSVVHLN